MRKKKTKTDEAVDHEPAELNPRHELFCQEYVVDLNATRAYKAVYGCSDVVAKVNGSRLLTYANVTARINKLMAEKFERTQITTDYVLSSIRDTIERCKQAKPVTNSRGEHVLTETPDGEIVPAYTFMAKEALRGLELLGKHHKLFTDKVEHSGKITLEDLLAGDEE